MSIINYKQLLELIKVMSDSFIPIWRFFLAKKEKNRNILKKLNIVFVLIYLIVFFFVGSLSPWAKTDIITYQNGLIKEVKKSAFFDFAPLYVKGAGVIFLIFILLSSFIIDLKDSLSATISKRFLYYDPNHSTDLRTWGVVTLLLFGYVLRITLFGVIFSIGLYTANTFSIVKSGVTIFINKIPSGISESFFDRILISVQNPFGMGDVGLGGTWESVFIISILNFSRVVIITFLIGAFGLILRSLPYSQKS